jgi:hypothetical protein
VKAKLRHRAAPTGSFDPLAPPGSFTDPELPAGYAPFNIQPIGNQVFASALIAGSLLASTGCGYGNSQGNRGTASIVVTATSGSLSHTATMNLTVQ